MAKESKKKEMKSIQDQILKQASQEDQKLDGLYQNWQAEYKEAMTPELCEEIQQFYEPNVKKYETKYKILYQILKQASQEETKVPPPNHLLWE